MAYPTILTSRSFPSLLISPEHGSIAWNDDGQCVLLTVAVAQILTPHLISTLPAPPALIDPKLTVENPVLSLYKAKRVDEATPAPAEADNDVDMESGPSKARSKLRRPPGGEVVWWANGVTDNGRERAWLYDWDGLGDEHNILVATDEPEMRSAVWSPSGLSDMGGCLLATMNNAGQVSVHAPSRYGYSKPWIEIADLTALSKSLLPDADTAPELSVRGMLHMRAMCMQWSPALPLETTLGRDGSLLAIAVRSGHIAFWSYGVERRFRRRALVKVASGLVTRMAWSPWTATRDSSCESSLYFATSDGAVSCMRIRQTASNEDPESPTWDANFDDPRVLDAGDGRCVTALTSVAGLLVWTKPGSVHFWSNGKDGKWDGTRMIRLERVGNWASANAYTTCIVVPDSVLIVTSSLSCFLVISISTSPALAPLENTLRLSLAVRETFMDYAREEFVPLSRKGTSADEERSVTAHTSGWAGLGEWGNVHAFVSEPTVFHDLDSANDAHRHLNFFLADLSPALPRGGPALSAGLQKVLGHPPRLLHVSPLKVFMPFMLHMLGLSDPAAAVIDLENLLSTELEAETAQPEVQRSTTNDEALSRALWADQELDVQRLRYVLALWCCSVAGNSRAPFETAAEATLQCIRQRMAAALTPWITDGVGGTGFEAKCPICGESIACGEDGKSSCSNGHDWARCSVTDRPVTNADYRVCTICPAVSILPTRLVRTPIAVGEDGVDRDWKRFSADIDQMKDDWKVQKALEAAIACVMCGGRWTRSM